MAKQVLRLESGVKLPYQPNVTKEFVQPVEKPRCLAYSGIMLAILN